jgi:hypothetical protein
MKALSGAAVILAGLSSCTTAISNDPTGRQVTLTAQERQLVSNGVRSTLKDPYSAVLGGMAAAKNSSGTITVCGTVNAKNSFGGYVGSNFYIGEISSDAFALSTVAKDDDQRVAIFSECERRGIHNWSAGQPPT